MNRNVDSVAMLLARRASLSCGRRGIEGDSLSWAVLLRLMRTIDHSESVIAWVETHI